MRPQIVASRDRDELRPEVLLDGGNPDNPRLHDLRFSALLGPAAWACLPRTIRRRFSTRLNPSAAITYAGEIVECRRSLFGKLIASLCRLLGGPLPLSDDIGVPAIVTVTEDGVTGGQFWTRMYGRVRGFPQVIHSSKRFAGPTGLEEYLGRGFGIALTVSAGAEAVYFCSDHYFFEMGHLRLRLPNWLGPGALTISHVDRGDESFAFVLSLHHPMFGAIIHQTGLFKERFAREDRNDLP